MSKYETPLIPGNCYHVFNHANGFENLFRNDGNYNYFLKKYAIYIPPVADTLAYCLMPNHVHFMVRIKPEHQLPAKFSQKEKPISHQISHEFGNLFNAYAQAFNKQQSRMGSLFIPNFKRRTVDNRFYFGNLICYIHNNPVEAGLGLQPADWPHSSFTSILSNKPSRLQREEVIQFFGGTQDFVKAHAKEPDLHFCSVVNEWF